MFQGAYPESPLVWVDAGNFAAVGIASAKVRNEGIIQGLNIIGYAAVMLGERELAGGYETFQAMQKQATFPFVSANIHFEDDGSTLVKPWVLHKVKHGEREIRIGIMGLNRYNTAFLKATRDGRNIVIASPFKVARTLVKEMRDEVDLVVALTSLSISQARQLAREAPGLDLIIGASGGVLSRAQDVAAGVPIVFSGNQGKYLAEVRVHLPADGEGKPGIRRRNHYLNRDYPQDPELQMLTQEVLGKENDINRDLATEHVEREPIPLSRATYAGSETCGTCHLETMLSWKLTSHATAFDTLVAKNQDFSEECVGCHTVGFGRRDGFVNAKATPELIHVQCESCHGPGSLHVKDNSGRYGAAGARSCLGCHDPENSPDFDFYISWPRIRH
ncbi:MAG: hypothetical protein E2P00_02420 [Acidobacteria bacterium]|nr:MAG: hypothetical protein E2P00_02420 [Acidobacteriota bacterium]